MATAVNVKIFPEDMEQFEAVKTALANIGFRVAKMDDEPLAFGMKAIRVVFVVQDSEGSTALEDKIRTVKGVSEVQVESMSLI